MITSYFYGTAVGGCVCDRRWKDGGSPLNATGKVRSRCDGAPDWVELMHTGLGGGGCSQISHTS